MISLLALPLACVLLVVVALCVMVEAVVKAWATFCHQGEREYAYLLDWSASNAGVGAAHGDRSRTRHTHVSDGLDAAGEGDGDGTPPRPEDGFYGRYAQVYATRCRHG
ncbi:hypothetical protein [Lysobacter enzymogenes]|uniref:hypothetical protein n=1 Tax=Lysobacter enzymogenes TaxID=69 RepID=UPI001AFB4D7B|nr:hypothetical protein [Lysobacter enzymogenes]QQQ03673.1 hypothetical protein JHW41_12355 [Lysobacter enzymogenes]